MSDLAVEGLVVPVGSGRHEFAAVDGVDLHVPAGTALGLVGESGSGKSTLARAIVGLAWPARGRVLLDGADYAGARGARLRRLRRAVQLVFQDPRASLNPRMTVGETIGEAIGADRRLGREARRAEVRRLLDLVALDPGHAQVRPPALSGGQRQRVALARALAVRPRVIIADEVTASLDVSVQGSVLNLLRGLARETGLSLVVISHNLAIVNYLCDRVAVMQLGRIVETAATRQVVDDPQHPYTRLLLDSVRRDLDDGDLAPAGGEAPDPLHPPSGCRFRTLCPVGPLAHPDRRRCVEEDPGRHARARRHAAACHFVPEDPE